MSTTAECQIHVEVKLKFIFISTRNAAVVGKRTTAVYAEGDRNSLFKCVSQWQK